MSIHQNINTSIGTVAGALAMNKHLKQQELQIKADDAADVEQIKSLNTAIANEGKEALEAIKANREKELEEYRSSFREDWEKPESKKQYDDFVANFDKKIEAGDVEGLRQDLKMIRERTLANAGKDYDTALKNETKVMNDPTASDEEKELAYGAPDIYKDSLNRAYKRLRETNQRIASYNKLKYNHDAAIERVKARGITNPKEIK